VIASPQVQRRLLDLQAIDTALARLASRKLTLPEIASIDTAEQVMSVLEEQRRRVREIALDLDREIDRLSNDVRRVRQRQERDEAWLNAAGVLTTAGLMFGQERVVRGVKDELGMLHRRLPELEKALLARMAKSDVAGDMLGAVQARVSAVTAGRDAADRRRREVLAEIGRQETLMTASRGLLAGVLPPKLIALYDKVLRETGQGAVKFESGRCAGCGV
jgi:predicted  nucleic acid-binding Zn-ribbon protein